jgi:hypothetical protein
LDFGGQSPSDGAKYRAAGEPPLLVIYAIDKVSSPKKVGGRLPLNAPDTPISLSVTLPRSTSFVEYVAPAIARVDLSIDHLDMADFQP